MIEGPLMSELRVRQDLVERRRKASERHVATRLKKRRRAAVANGLTDR